MKSVLMEALLRLPKCKTITDTRFYWRIILERFQGNEDTVCDFLNSLKDESPVTKRIYLVVSTMKELSAEAAIYLWDRSHCDEAGVLQEAADRRFRSLTVTEQLAVLESCLKSERIAAWYISSLLGRINAEDPIKKVAAYLHEKDQGERENRHIVMCFLTVVTCMVLKPV